MEMLAMDEIINLVILTVILLVGLFFLRLAFKLTATLLRIGCGLILLIVAGAAILMFLNVG